MPSPSRYYWPFLLLAVVWVIAVVLLLKATGERREPAWSYDCDNAPYVYKEANCP